MIAVWEGSVNGSPPGIMLCIIGTVCNAAMMSTSGRILSEKLDVLRLAFYTAPVSCIALFPFCYFHEVSFSIIKFLSHKQACSCCYLIPPISTRLQIFRCLYHGKLGAYATSADSCIVAEYLLAHILVSQNSHLHLHALLRTK